MIFRCQDLDTAKQMNSFFVSTSTLKGTCEPNCTVKLVKPFNDIDKTVFFKLRITIYQFNLASECYPNVTLTVILTRLNKTILFC